MCAPEEKRVLCGRLENSVEKREVWLAFRVASASCCLAICSLIILSIIENGVLKSLIRIIYMSVSPFSSVGFASCIFWVCFLVHIVCLPDFFVIKNTFYLQPYLFI